MESIRIVKTDRRVSKNIIVRNLLHDKRNLSYYLYRRQYNNKFYNINVKSVSVCMYVRMVVWMDVMGVQVGLNGFLRYIRR